MHGNCCCLPSAEPLVLTHCGVQVKALLHAKILGKEAQKDICVQGIPQRKEPSFFFIRASLIPLQAHMEQCEFLL